MKPYDRPISCHPCHRWRRIGLDSYQQETSWDMRILKVFRPGDIGSDARLKIQFLEILKCLMKIRLRHSQILHSSDLSFCIDGVPKGDHGLEMLLDGIEERNLGTLMLVDMIGVQGGMSLRDDGVVVRRFQYVCMVRQ